MGAAIPLLLQLTCALPPILPFAKEEIETEITTQTCEVQDEVLRGVVVGEVERLRDAGRLHDDALRDGLAHDVDTRERVRLHVHLLLDRGELLIAQVHRDEHDLRVDAVFGLREQVRRDEARVGGVVRDDLSSC